MIYRILLFLVLNFLALAIGGIFTNKGVTSEWYTNLLKAPWTPPGWVFGFAWTFIMVFLAFYMAFLWTEVGEFKKILIGLFVLQWVLNVLWNPAFFYYHNMVLGMILISALTVLVGFMLLYYWPELKFKSLLLLPYFIWLLIASSLNGYILLKN